LGKNIAGRFHHDAATNDSSVKGTK